MVFALSGGRAAADGINGYMDFTYTSAKGRTEDSSGQSLETKTDSLVQRYSLTLDRHFYPNLGVLAGGLFERNGTTLTMDGQETDTTTTRIKPFVNLALRTPLYQLEGGYDLNEIETKTSGTGPATRVSTLVNEDYYATLGWKPVGYPVATFRYFRTNTYDKERLSQDTTDDRFQLDSDFRPIPAVQLRYTGVYDDKVDHIGGNETRTLTNDGRASYADQFWKKRISLSSEYHLTYTVTDILNSGAGEVGLPLSPLAGLSAISDTPLDVALAPNPALIDGDLTASTGVNLGLPPPGGDARPRNIGLDFVNETRVNTLLVWIDRDLRPEIAGAFSWDVYTSADNKTWAFRQTVFPATFGPFQTRFEIRFADVTARYVKVVTRPLSPAVPFASDFPNILVTELQAVLREPAAEVQGRTSEASHRYSLNARARILDAPSLYYEFSYLLLKTGTSPFRYDLSNGLSLSHTFSRVFSGTARVAREDGRQPAGARVAYVYSASLTAVPLETLRHSLVYSGRRETIGDQTTTNDSLFLLNTAQLYPGVDASLGLGKSFDTAATGVSTDATQVNAGMTLVPYPAMTVNLSFSDTTRKSSGGNLAAEKTETTRTSEVSVAWTPLRTLYLFGSFAKQAAPGTANTTTFNYAVTWSPFPDGTLHLGFNYNETLHLENNEKDRTITPTLRWNIARGSYFELTYQDLLNDAPTQKTSNRISTGTLHVAF